MPARIVRRRRDGLVQIRPSRMIDRLRPVAGDLLLAIGIVVAGALAYFTLMMAFYLLAILVGLWTLRILWRELRPRPRVRLAIERHPERPRLAVVRGERTSHS